jgi:hypothetical protein
MPQFSHTQQCILSVLADGMPHDMDELVGAVPDELATPKTVKNHLYIIRIKLRPIGQDIICQFLNRQRLYRQVRLLSSAVDGVH